MKLTPTQAHALLRAKLRALAENEAAHPGEVAGAKARLADLEKKYDFTQAIAADDIFSGIKGAVASGTAQIVFSFTQAESDIGALVQWAIANRFAVQTRIRTGADWQSSLWVEAHADSIPALRKIARGIRDQFSALWQTMATAATVDAGDRRPFLLGLYDGMMDDPRAPGSMLPARSFPTAPAKKIKRKALAHAPRLATHPYTLALALGRKIRLRGTVRQTTKELRNVIATLTQAAA